MGNQVPTGYLSCDGATYNIADYPKLAEQIKTEFGSYNHYGGDGETTFAVPDLRGEFLRGTGTATRNSGSGAAVGAHQEPTYIPNAIFGYNNVFYINKADVSANNETNVMITNPDKLNGSYYSRAQFEATYAYTQEHAQSDSASIRPTNTSVLYCIKY